MSTFDVDAGNNDATMTGMSMSQIAELASAVASPSRRQLARALWGVGSLTLLVDVSAALYQPAMGPVFGGHRVAYYGVLGAILAVVAVEMVTGYWLSCSSGQDHGWRFLAFAKGLLRFAVVLLLIVVAIGGFALTIRA